MLLRVIVDLKQKECEKIVSIRKMVSFNPLVLEALDAVAKAQKMKRSALIEKCVENYPDVYQVLEGIREQVKPDV